MVCRRRRSRCGRVDAVVVIGALVLSQFDMVDMPLDPAFAPAAPGSLALAQGEVHVWAVRLTGDPEQFAQVLSSAELDRVHRFRFADHQRRYQVCHGVVRFILGGYLGCRPADVEFRHGPRGKPFIEGQALDFNISHSGNLALVAVGTRPLGVDVEKLRRLESLSQIAERHFSSLECDVLNRLEGGARELGFYRCWTRKEAYIKALGEGLAMALDSFDVCLDKEPSLLACRDSDEHPAAWSMLDVSPAEDFVGALAVRERPVRVTRLQFQA